MPSSVTLVAAACTICVAYAYYTSDVSKNELDQRRARSSTISTLGALLWPLILFEAVPKEDHGESGLLLPMAWGLLTWWLDMYLLHKAPGNTVTKPASLRLEPSSVTALTFGLAGILGAKPHCRHINLFLYAIVGCMVLVFPSHTLQPDCVQQQVFEDVQKVALGWCIGLLLAGVVLIKSCSTAQ